MTPRVRAHPLIVPALACAAMTASATADNVERHLAPAGDARVRETDPCRCFQPGPQQVLPDLVEVSLSGWSPTSPSTDLFSGVVVPQNNGNPPRFFRMQVILNGRVNPPGGLGLSPAAAYSPFQFGPSPIYGFIELDIDRNEDTGGEPPAAAANRFLANAARFGARPKGSRGGRAAECDADLFLPWDQSPLICRSGEDFALVFCGCFPVTVVNTSYPSGPTFGPGDTWVVQGRFFQRAGAYTPACGTVGGSAIGAYDPVVKLQFKHDAATDRTTITLVYPLDQIGAQLMSAAAAPPPLNTSITDGFSVQEAVQELINRAGNLAGVGGLARAATEGWAGESFSTDIRNPTRWRVNAILGTTYPSSAPAASPYVWTDIGFDVITGDMNGDGMVSSPDGQYICNRIQSLDGVPDRDVDAAVNGSVVLPDFGVSFHRADVNADGRIDIADLRLVGGAPCPADFDLSGSISLDDLFIYLKAWFAGELRCDVDPSPGISLDDLFVYVDLWFGGC